MLSDAGRLHALGLLSVYLLVARKKGSHIADSDEVSHPVRAKGATYSEGRGPPDPSEGAHPSERSDAGGVGHAETVWVEVVFGSFLRMDAPLRVMRCA